MVKHGIMLVSGVFFFCCTKLGMFNKIFFCLLTSQSLVFVQKTNLYQGCIEDLATCMTLTGQEARLQVRFHMPDHPQVELFEQLCIEYKNLSAKQLEKHLKQINSVANAKEREEKLDKEFSKRLALLEADENGPDSIDAELP